MYTRHLPHPVAIVDYTHVQRISTYHVVALVDWTHVGSATASFNLVTVTKEQEVHSPNSRTKRGLIPIRIVKLISTLV